MEIIIENELEHKNQSHCSEFSWPFWLGHVDPREAHHCPGRALYGLAGDDLLPFQLVLDGHDGRDDRDAELELEHNKAQRDWK